MESNAIRRRVFTSGHAAVIGMLALAVAAATFAWWWNFNSGRRALELFGSDGARLVRSAKTVEIMATAGTNTLDISKAPGLLNARASLLSDASYEWQSTQPSPIDPQAAVRFRDGDNAVIVVFDFDTRQLNANSRTVMLNRKTADGWKSYLERQLKAGENR
jgi:hypothetical protein